jgi:hypothetical protein
MSYPKKMPHLSAQDKSNRIPSQFTVMRQRQTWGPQGSDCEHSIILEVPQKVFNTAQVVKNEISQTSEVDKVSLRE